MPAASLLPMVLLLTAMNAFSKELTCRASSSRTKPSTEAPTNSLVLLSGV